MKSSINILLLLTLLIVNSSSSCKKGNNTDDCEGVACTMEFAYITLNVTDSAGQKVQLDSVYTQNSKTGAVITHQENGTGMGYVVLDDSYHKNITHDTVAFYLKGIKDGKEIVNEPFVITADCCHIRKVSGKTDLQL